MTPSSPSGEPAISLHDFTDIDHAVEPTYVAALEAWLRDPPAQKPMAPDEARGMPDLNLTEEQIDALVAYLETLE